MKRYINIYKSFLRVNIIREMEFRLNFFLRTLVYLIWAGLGFLSINILVGQIDTVAGWNKEQIFILFLTYMFSNALYKLIFHVGVNELPELIRNGKLDFAFTKPLNMRFLISVKRFKFDQLPRLVLFSLIYLKIIPDILSTFTTIRILGFTFLILLGVFGLYSLLFAISCYVFWKPRVWNIFSLTDRITEFAQYPSKIYKGILYYFVMMLPLATFAYIPTRFLLDPDITLILYSITLTVFIYIISRLVWKCGLKKYESASS